VRKAGTYVTRKIGEETLVVPIRGTAAELDSVFVLNDVGAVIWDQLDAHHGPEEIAQAVAADFDVSADVARQDVALFLHALKDAGVVIDQID
jgi:hypothetical protein